MSTTATKSAAKTGIGARVPRLELKRLAAGRQESG